MARRQPHLHLRGGVYQLRMRVPDALRPLVGKTEIWKSLQTGELKEAQQRARIERVKLDAEWTALRQQLAPARVEALSEAEIWNLVAKWFVETERQNAAAPIPADWTRHDAEVELGHVSTWGEAGASVFKEADRLLREEGKALPTDSASFVQLQKALHKAWIETERRQINRVFPGARQNFDPDFAGLTKSTTVQPVAKNTMASVMEAVENDPTKSKAVGKTAIKRDGQWRVLKEFFGENTDMKAIARPRVREFMALLEKLPSNASKHFPGKTIFEAVEFRRAMRAAYR